MGRRTDTSHGRRVFSQFQAVNRSSASASGSSASARLLQRAIPIDVSAWVADSVLYRSAPNLGPLHYADIMHGFGLLTVMAVGFLDTDGHVTNGQFFQDQMPTPSNPYGSLRVWIDPVPAGTITVFVQAFA